MSKPLTDKVAIITGGSKGIGAAIATALHTLGAKVVINYGRDADAAALLVDKLGGPARSLAVQADVASITGVEKLIQETINWSGGKIDILIPNAGVLPMKTVENTTEKDFDQTYNLNVKGPYFLVQKALPFMSQGSSIVFLSTSQNFASTVNASYTLYCSTKGAVDQMIRTMSKDLAPRDINVNGVAPGPTGTDLFFKGKDQKTIDMIASLNPRKRIGSPEEVADAIAYLCSSGARWVTGQTIRVNGGQV